MDDAKNSIPVAHLFGENTRYSGRSIWKIIEDDNLITVQYRGLHWLCYVFVSFTWLLLGFVSSFIIETRVLEQLFFVLMLIAAFVSVILMYFFNKEQASMGDWLTYDIKKQTISLPRVPISLEKKQLHMIQVIVGIPKFAERFLTEVNIVVSDESGYRRYQLLKVASPNLIEPLILKLSKILSVDVQRVNCLLTGSVNIVHPYRG